MWSTYEWYHENRSLLLGHNLNFFSPISIISYQREPSLGSLRRFNVILFIFHGVIVSFTDVYFQVLLFFVSLWIFSLMDLELTFHSTKPYNLRKIMKFSIKGFFSKCNQIRIFLPQRSHLLKKSLMENFIFFVWCTSWGKPNHPKWRLDRLLNIYANINFRIVP